MSANLIPKGTRYERKHRIVPLDEIRPEMRVRNSQRDFRIQIHTQSLKTKFALIFDPKHNHKWSSPIFYTQKSGVQIQNCRIVTVVKT